SVNVYFLSFVLFATPEEMSLTTSICPMKQSKYFLLLLVAFLYIGCDEPTQQVNHSGTTSGTGSLFGFINVIQSNGDRASDLSGVIVGADNGTSTTSDSTGRW